MKLTKFLQHSSLRAGITLLAVGGIFDPSPVAAMLADIPMTRQEECLAVHDGIGIKASFANLPDGRLIAWTRGRFHASSDHGLTFSESWEPRYVKSSDKVNWGQPSLIVLKNNALGVLTDIVPAPTGDYESRIAAMGPPPNEKTDPKAHKAYREKIKEMRKEVSPENKKYIAFWRSEDGGRTWSRPVRISPMGDYNQQPLNHVAVRTQSGRILFPVYGNGHLYVYRSDDEGKTWVQSKDWVRSYFRYQGQEKLLDEDEPCIVEVKPRSFLMVMRTDVGRIYQSWSHDNGETWTEGAPTDLMANNSPAQVAKIPGTNDLVIVFNQGNTIEARYEFYRSRLSTAISRDGGKTWVNFQNIESSLEGTYIPPEPMIPEWTLKGLNLRNDNLPGLGPKPTGMDKHGSGRLHGSFTYPSIIFSGKHFIVGHADLHWDKDRKHVSIGRTRVVPISWLYGGMSAQKVSAK